MIERENIRMASEATLIRAAAASVLAKEAGELFDELIEGLHNGE